MKSARDDLNFTISPIPKRRRMRASKETDNEMKYSKSLFDLRVPIALSTCFFLYLIQSLSLSPSNLLLRLFCTFCAIQTSKSFQTSHQLQQLLSISSHLRSVALIFRLFDLKHIVKCSFKSAL